MTRGFFITGTDTDVGKTAVCAWLLRAWNADYWKPVQCGFDESGKTDGQRVLELSGAEPSRLHPPLYSFRAPVSPHEAARRENTEISLRSFILPETPRLLLVEGAGGILVPLDRDLTNADLMKHLGLPVLLVARTALGTINHTLLSLETLHHRGLEVAGIIFCGAAEPVAEAAIATRSHGVPVLGLLPWMAPMDAASLHACAAPAIPGGRA